MPDLGLRRSRRQAADAARPDLSPWGLHRSSTRSVRLVLTLPATGSAAHERAPVTAIHFALEGSEAEAEAAGRAGSFGHVSDA
jgi:hypothetical protein